MQSERKPRRAARSTEGEDAAEPRIARAAVPEESGPPVFEESLERLDDIVNQLETGQLSLEESLTLYERGVSLAQRCQEMLDAAELRVQRLRAATPDDSLGDVDTGYILETFEIDED